MNQVNQGTKKKLITESIIWRLIGLSGNYGNRLKFTRQPDGKTRTDEVIGGAAANPLT